MGFPKEMEPRSREEGDNPKRGRAGYRLRVGKGKEKPVQLNVEEGGARERLEEKAGPLVEDGP